MSSLGDRMKGYEKAFCNVFPRRLPVIIRLDGKAFHTVTRFMSKPFDVDLITAMHNTAKFVCGNVQNAVFAYVQSDEISILMNSAVRLTTEPWFNNEQSKIESISAALASSFFSMNWVGRRAVQFDSRAFVLPEDEVCNYFIWRQQDWERNSVQMLARAHYSHKECHKKNCNDLQDMLHEKGVNWNDLSTHLKRGVCLYKRKVEHEVAGDDVEYDQRIMKTVYRTEWYIDKEPAIFTKDREFIEQHLAREE